MFIEPMELRRFLTVVSATFDASTGVVALVGNDKRDIIDVTPLNGGGVTASFDGKHVDYPGNVKRIEIHTKGGGDLIDLSEVVGILTFVDAGAGPDSVNGGTGNDTLLGGGGPDVLFGGSGNDSLDGGLQGDLVDAGKGNDSIAGGSVSGNQDTITGGKGHDTVNFSQASVGVFVKVGSVTTPNQSDLVQGDVETLIGSPFNDELVNGTKRGMLIEGGAGDDTLCGGSGNDTIVGGAGNNQLEGFGGNDTFDISAGGHDSVFGGSGTDSVIGGASDDMLNSVP